MQLAEAVGLMLAGAGADHVFGLVGSGNFHVTNALIACGARFVPAAHEGGAATMADAFARVSGRRCVLSVHQGPGVTNALTGITEAAKSRTPIVVLAPEAPNARSNFYLDLAALADAVGASYVRVRDVEDVARALALDGTVVLGLPLDAQGLPAEPIPIDEVSNGQSDVDVEELVEALERAERPVFIAGRGAVRARDELIALADRCGALLATSAAAKGLFEGDPRNLDVSGGFASPRTAELVRAADLVVAWGSTLNMWTTRHGRLIGPHATVIQVDRDPEALGVNRAIDVGVVGDVAAVATAAAAIILGGRPPAQTGGSTRWRDVSYVEEGVPGTIDPRTLSIALDDLLPRERTLAVDSGNFMGYPSMFMSVPDVHGFVFTQAFQSVGLGLASAVGAALARPDRLTVAALGDGGFQMSVAELTTVVRLGIPMVVVVYNDAAFGAEVHHFGPDGYPLETVTFPDSDLAAVARGFGCDAVTVRALADLEPVRKWLDSSRERALVIDAKVGGDRGSWWLEEAFRGH
ncbi:MAG TPA: thiamine pyrophosphate-dependent enzyme [Candidatus Limnocylindrales bacterium]|nr:thiamine pyrophosphate-dependent enzyme [Candidatus Limnocylindrales bacterium]